MVENEWSWSLVPNPSWHFGGYLGKKMVNLGAWMWQARDVDKWWWCWEVGQPPHDWQWRKLSLHRCQSVNEERGEDMSGVSARESVGCCPLAAQVWWVVYCTWTSQSMRHNDQNSDSLHEEEKLVLLLDKGCQHLSVVKNITSLWSARFQ